MVTKWYLPTASSNPCPCEWVVWCPPTTASEAGRWIVVYLAN
jgi:hypothetical protein